MGNITGFICSKCNHEKSYFLGVGFLNQKETRLFECSNCEVLKQSVLPNPQCSKCKKNTLIEVADFDKKYKCPKCESKEFKNEIVGNWD